MIATTIETFSGVRFDLTQPRSLDVSLIDIAHHLARLARFNGATTEFYSVAQHCVLVADKLFEIDSRNGHGNLAIKGLLHDAAEAYVGDSTSPLKQAVPALSRLEKGIQAAIYGHFCLSVTDNEQAHIKQVDRLITGVEAWNFMPSKGRWWIDPPASADAWHIAPVSIDDAEKTFLERYKRYMRQ